MKLLLKLISAIFTTVFAIYLLLPNPEFPAPPDDAIQSEEPADTETPFRRAYFTNYSREEVIQHYKNQIDDIPLLLRLNYPPEEAQIIIRDQTRSNYLEELTHPLRNSLYINGFIPQQAKDEIIYEEQRFEQKITIKYVPNDPITRLIISFAALGVSYLVFREWLYTAKELWPKKK